MPLDTLYLVRHAHRLNWSIDIETGIYRANYPSPTGIPVDPTLTGPGVAQSLELAEHVSGTAFSPKPCRIYSSPFYRCLQTIQPTVEALKDLQETEKRDDVELTVRTENGLGEWFGSSPFFTHPSPATLEVLRPLFPTLLSPESPLSSTYTAHVYPSPNGETITELHDRVAAALHAIITEVDAEIRKYEQAHPESAHESRGILICSHAAPLIAMGRALTGNMPEDTSVEDFKVFTSSLSTYVRRRNPINSTPGMQPSWRDGQGVAGGWDCVLNGDCSFLSEGEEKGWHFSGEEDFSSMPIDSSGNNTTSLTKL
ncbi:hypothetical protein FQN57_000085 [Myotisia sp. PD_48]|nr:hypothetical protein FQN57_000085 [Myotisia sp. PD_48]